MSLFIQFSKFNRADVVVPALHAGCFGESFYDVFNHDATIACYVMTGIKK
jgi:hypothetical protein